MIRQFDLREISLSESGYVYLGCEKSRLGEIRSEQVRHGILYHLQIALNRVTEQHACMTCLE